MQTLLSSEAKSELATAALPGSGRAETWVRNILLKAGIEINGPHPWDIQVRDRRFYERVVFEGSLGFGESYMDGQWDAAALDELFCRIHAANLSGHVKNHWPSQLRAMAGTLFNLQKKSRAFEIGKRHYDLGNDLFLNMLDPRMVYSCGYWPHAQTLEEAQEAKLDLVCRKLGLKPGMQVLDIGCGWGSFGKYAAENYGVEVTGLTVSEEQAVFAVQNCRGLPVSSLVMDYRDLQGVYDRVCSIGMFEHVGHKNYQTFMKKISECTAPDGLFLLHTIAIGETSHDHDPWMHKYIFPNFELPSWEQITNALDEYWVMEDWHSFGADYDPTLMAWFANFNRNWPRLKDRYGERFYRMWKYYLMGSAGLFRSGSAHVLQFVLAKERVRSTHAAVR